MGLVNKNLASKFINLLPLILLFFLCLKDDTIFSFRFFDYLTINMQYIVIFYWVLKKPEILGYGFIFLAGIITDVILGLPMGISSLCYLTISTMATYTRIVTVKITLFTDWLTFIPALLAANLVYFLVLYFYGTPVSYVNILSASFFTFILYPFIWLPFEIFRRYAGGN